MLDAALSVKAETLLQACGLGFLALIATLFQGKSFRHKGDSLCHLWIFIGACAKALIRTELRGKE